jgi:glutaconate CoA-transferase subunit A
LNGWKLLEDPYGHADPVWVIPAIKPDYAVIHASEIDELGNVRIAGTYHWERIMSRASGSVLVVAERLVPTSVFQANPESTVVPYFMVEAFSIVPNGAWPGSCWPDYPVDYPAVERYLKPGDEFLAEHLANGPELRQLA